MDLIQNQHEKVNWNEKYLAHINNSSKEQSLKEHLLETARLASGFADKFGCGEWGYCCGMLHDIGKYSTAFQKRLAGSEKKVDHSTAGAQLCWDMNGMHRFLSYCIAGHHAGLPDTGSSADARYQNLWRGNDYVCESSVELWTSPGTGTTGVCQKY